MTLDFSRPPEWTKRARCAETDPEAFFPDKSSRGFTAKRVCGECPVATECLEYALEHDEQYGVWGGMNVGDRAAIKRQRAA